MLRSAILLLLAPLALGCGSGSESASANVFGGGDGGGLPVTGCAPSSPPTRFISCVLSFQPGPGAGWGQDDFPEIIYGPPVGGGMGKGGVDVLSLGGGGEIAFGFGGNAIVDGPGTDFVVFENPFDIAGNPKAPYAELGEVS